MAAAGDTSRWNSLVEAAVLDWWDLVSTRVLIHPTNQTAPQRRFCFSTRDGRRSKVCLNVLHPSAPRSRIVVLQVLSSPPIQIVLINNIFCVLITKLLLNFFVSSLKTASHPILRVTLVGTEPLDVETKSWLGVMWNTKQSGFLAVRQKSDGIAYSR